MLSMLYAPFGLIDVYNAFNERKVLTAVQSRYHAMFIGVKGRNLSLNPYALPLATSRSLNSDLQYQQGVSMM